MANGGEQCSRGVYCEHFLHLLEKTQLHWQRAADRILLQVPGMFMRAEGDEAGVSVPQLRVLNHLVAGGAACAKAGDGQQLQFR